MSSIIISNVTESNKSPLDYYKNDSYEKFAIASSTSTIVPFYKDLLRMVLDKKVDETFKDFALSKEQTQQIKIVFEEQIDANLSLIEPVEGRRYKSWTLEWKGKSYDMNLSLISPKSRNIQDFYKIVTIAEECLAENKPMYLSIE
jgi:hypothetical protein